MCWKLDAENMVCSVRSGTMTQRQPSCWDPHAIFDSKFAAGVCGLKATCTQPRACLQASASIQNKHPLLPQPAERGCAKAHHTISTAKRQRHTPPLERSQVIPAASQAHMCMVLMLALGSLCQSTQNGHFTQPMRVDANAHTRLGIASTSP